MFIGLSFPIILHQSFIPYVIEISCPSSLINQSYPMFMGISFPVILHQSFIPYVYRNVIPRHLSSIILTLYIYIGISFPIILHQSFIPYVYRNIIPVIIHQSFIPYVYRNIMPRHPSSIIHTLCLLEYYSPSSFLNHSYPMFIGISFRIILHQSFIPDVYRNIMPRHPSSISHTLVYRNLVPRHPSSIIHTLCLTEYHSPSSFINRSYPMCNGI